MIDWTKITGFDWDEGNSRKNEKHGISMAESEQVFFNVPLLTLEDYYIAIWNHVFTHSEKQMMDGNCT
jgi:hypothetical protein